MDERHQIEATIAALEGQRALLGDDVVDIALAPLYNKLKNAKSMNVQEQQKKHITILFADLSGFTALAETMDAEDIHSLMDGLWQRLDTIIHNYGGTIDKHIGDAVMALWGTPSTREDDVEQSIRAALAMQVELALFCQERTVNLGMRIGINTGPVLLGSVGSTGEFTAMGDAVNLASRMEHAAPPGRILISHDTYRHVRGIVDVEPCEPLSVKGKLAPIQTYLVNSVKSRQFSLGSRGIEGIETKMIGRDWELQYLKDTYHHVLKQRTLCSVMILGDAGMGKSRLIYEFRTWMELQTARLRLFSGRATQDMMLHSYALFRNMIFFRFDMRDSDSAIVLWNKFIDGLMKLFGLSLTDAVVQATYIGQLIGLDVQQSPIYSNIVKDSQQIRDQAFTYLKHLFISLATAEPILILAEDIHWSDRASLELLTMLVQNCTHLPVFIICVARPSFSLQDAMWTQGHNDTSIPLQPLNTDSSQQLVDELLQKVQVVPDSLREIITSRAEGNPFYIEELVKMLIDEGVIVRDLPRWKIYLERLGTLQVPPTLTGVLQARFDTLSAHEKIVLQYAAVVGRIFWDHAITAIIPQHLDLSTDIYTILATLQQRELIFRRDVSRFYEATEYIFKHALLRDVVYERMLKRDRRYAHDRAAAWILDSTEEHLDAMVAEHYEQAEDYATAGYWYSQAGLKALNRYDLSTSLQAYHKTLTLYEQLFGVEHPNTAQSMHNLANVYRMQGRAGDAEPLYQQALKIRQHVLGSDHPETAISLDHLARVYMAQQRFGEAELLALWSLAIREQVLGEDHPETAESIYHLALLYEAQGRYGDVEPLSRRALDIRKQVLGSDHPETAASLDHLASVYETQQRFGEAELLALWALTIREQVLGEDHPHTAVSLNTLARLYIIQGRYDEAEPLYERALMSTRKILGTNHPDTAQNLRQLALIYERQGRYAEAEPLLQQALAIHEFMLGIEHSETANSVHNLALLYEQQGCYREAEPLYQLALEIRSKVLGLNHPDVATSLNNLAQLYRIIGHYRDAEPLYQQSLSIRQAIFGSTHAETAQSMRNLGVLYYQQGRYKEAEPLYQQALAIYQQALGSEHPQIATCLNNLAELYKIQGLYTKAEQLYEQALVINQESLGLFHPYTANILHNLAHLHSLHGRYAQAMSLYEQAHNVYSKVFYSDHPYTARNYITLAEMYQLQGRYDEAESLYLQAVTINERILGSNHPETAEALNTLAGLYRTLCFYTKAESHYKRALSIRKQILGLYHPDTALSINTLASVYFSRGYYTKAQRLYKLAYKIREQILGMNHPSTASSLNNLAIVAEFQRCYEKAILYYEQALAIREQILGLIHIDTASSLNNLANFYETTGRYDEAEQLYNQVLIILTEAVGSDHHYIAIAMNNLACVYFHQKRFIEAIIRTEQALNIVKQYSSKEDSLRAVIMSNLAALYEHEQRYAEAEKAYHQAFEIREQVLGLSHISTLISAHNLSALYQNQDLFGNATFLQEYAQELLTAPDQNLLATQIDQAMKFSHKWYILSS